MKSREEEIGTRRLTKRTLRVSEKLAQCADQNASPHSDKGGVRNDHEHGRVHGRASGPLSSPHIPRKQKHLPKAGQLELYRRSSELRLHQSQSIGEIKSTGVQQYFPQLAPVTVVRQDKGHYSGL